MSIHPSTFSIVAYDFTNGDLGIAVASKFLAVGAVVPWAVAGVGAVATQSYANTAYGPDGLALMKSGKDAQTALAELLANDAGGHVKRQVGLVDARGNAATYTGQECHAWAGGRTGQGYACQGNILAGAAVVDAMAETFEATSGELAERLVTALAAGQAAGGDARGQESAALLVVRAGGGYAGYNDRYIDLRVEDHPLPIEELKRVLSIHRLYFTRPRAEDVITIDADIACDLQVILQRTGYLQREPTGVYDEATRDALRALSGVENLEERWRDGAEIDRFALEFLRRKFLAL